MTKCMRTMLCKRQRLPFIVNINKPTLFATKLWCWRSDVDLLATTNNTHFATTTIIDFCNYIYITGHPSQSIWVYPSPAPTSHLPPVMMTLYKYLSKRSGNYNTIPNHPAVLKKLLIIIFSYNLSGLKPCNAY